jgi:hypothetical protein
VRARFPKAFVVVSVVVTALVAGGCRKSSEEQRREAQQATEEAEQKASQTTITSAELGTAGNEEREDDAKEARGRALREHAEAITTARNEQLEYRAKLQAALDELDHKRRDARKHGHGHVHVKAIDARRELLRHDLDVLDRTTDADWASLKAKIDRDLKDHAGAAPHGHAVEGEGK